MIPVATEKAGLPDDWSVLGAAVFAGIGVVVVRPHLYSIRSPPQGIVVEGTRSHRRQLKGTSERFSPERGQYLSPGFQPWVSAIQECALKVARE